MAEVAERSPMEILKAAKERISDPERWTRGWFARNGAGHRVEASSPNAVCYCAAGSLYAEEAIPLRADIVELADGRPAFECLISAAAPRTISYINDHDGHAATLAMFDRAIQLAEQEATDA